MSTENKDINNEHEEVFAEMENISIEDDNQSVDDATVALSDELAKEKDKFLRLFAEFENYKKRTSRERLDLFKTANEDVLFSLLPILDDFDRALAEMMKLGNSEYLTGVTLISNKLLDILSSKGLKEVVLQKGDFFNVDIAEAITQIPAGDDMKGKIVDIVEKGYQLGDKIIRFPKVVIGQ